MRASLSSAVNTVNIEQSSSSQSSRPRRQEYGRLFIYLDNYFLDISSTLDALDVNRQTKIDEIEESGFKPTAFKSSAGGAGGRIKKQVDI